MVLRFVDGSIDMLDEFMALPAFAATKFSDTGSADAQASCLTLCQSGTPSLPQHTFCKVHSADPVAPALKEQHNDTQSQDILHTSTASGQQQLTEVAVLHKDNLSYQQFIDNFMQPNMPVMIQVEGFPHPWHAMLS